MEQSVPVAKRSNMPNRPTVDIEISAIAGDLE